MLDENLSGSNMLVVDTFDYNSHVFNLVKEKEKYYLKFENDERLIRRLVIKPNLWAIFEYGYEEGVRLLKPCCSNVDKVLAMDFNIDPEIFNLLIDNRLIIYSKAMADLYSLPVEFSRDYLFHHRDYKRKGNKEKNLLKLKSGNFN